jgi:hypothetical protein
MKVSKLRLLNLFTNVLCLPLGQLYNRNDIVDQYRYFWDNKPPHTGYVRAFHHRGPRVCSHLHTI